MTASRVFRGGQNVSRETRRRVELVAAELGYVPNRIAGALASRHVNLVGVIIPSLTSAVFPEVLAGVTAQLAKSDLQPVIGVSGYDLNREEGVIREMLSWRPTGLIVAGLEHTAAARKMLKSADTTVVEIMDTDGTPIDCCVGISHIRAGQIMASELLARGYLKIGFIGTKMPDDFRAKKRLAGFEQGLAQNHITLRARELYTGASSILKGREMTAAMLQRYPDIDCIYYSSDVLSAGGLMHCLANEINSPGQLGLAGFNRLDLLAGLPLSLATMDSHRFDVGKIAAKLVLTPPKDALSADKIIEMAPVFYPAKSI